MIRMAATCSVGSDHQQTRHGVFLEHILVCALMFTLMLTLMFTTAKALLHRHQLPIALLKQLLHGLPTSSVFYTRYHLMFKLLVHNRVAEAGPSIFLAGPEMFEIVTYAAASAAQMICQARTLKRPAPTRAGGNGKVDIFYAGYPFLQ
jgi:hypothetical protein